MKQSEKLSNSSEKIVVIGTSAGGRAALFTLLGQLPEDFAAPILIVQHLSTDVPAETLPKIFNTHSKLPTQLATNGTHAKAGSVYLAPPDHHLMVNEDGKMILTKGATENRFRPAVDPLFRSAATTYGTNAIAVLLTGYLDDGTSGIVAIQRCGGTTIVQDPRDASYPEMPMNALGQMKPDYCLPLAEIGAVLYHSVKNPATNKIPIPKDIEKEAGIAHRVLSDLPTVNALGEQVPFNCPGCGGVLWKMENVDTLRYRCHVGHAYTASSLLEEQNKKVEETMWTALRMFEERRNLLVTMVRTQKEPLASLTRERIQVSQVHIDRIRAILNADLT